MQANIFQRIIILLGVLFIQTIWPTAYGFAFLKFDAFLVLAVVLALTVDLTEAVLLAFFLGALQDFLAGGQLLQVGILPLIVMGTAGLKQLLDNSTSVNIVLMTLIFTTVEIVLQGLIYCWLTGLVIRPGEWSVYLVLSLVGNLLLAVVGLFIHEEIERNAYRFSNYNPMIRQI
jgi:hypothetical protein